MTRTRLTFDPLMCFAKPGQTPDELFDDIQERMRTMVGVGLSRLRPEDIQLFAKANDMSQALLSELARWQQSKTLITTGDFDKFASLLSISVFDIMGYPRVTDEQKKLLQAALPIAEGNIDPVNTYLLLGALDRIDELVRERKVLSLLGDLHRSLPDIRGTTRHISIGEAEEAFRKS